MISEKVIAYYGSTPCGGTAEIEQKKRELLSDLSEYIIKNNIANFIVEPEKCLLSIEMHISKPEYWLYNHLEDNKNER